MDVDGDILDISEISNREEMMAEETPLLIFRVIGCTCVTILVGFTIIIYVTSGMFHLDCVAQICSEACILVSYMLILLTTTETFKINRVMCFTIAFFLQFLFIGAFLFSVLEVFCISQVMISFFQRKAFFTTKSVMLIGWACPAVISGLSASIWHESYTTKTNCWVNMLRPPKLANVIPISVCICVQAILLLRILFISDVPLFVPQSQFKRAKCYLTTRWASTLIIIMLTASWSCGMMAYHTRRETLYAAFTVCSIVLGVCVFTLRISTDDEIRKVIITHVLCFIVPSNKVTAFSPETIKAKQAFVENCNGIKNGKIMTEEPRNVTAHK